MSDHGWGQPPGTPQAPPPQGFGAPPPQGYGAPPRPGPSGNAIAALVLGIVSYVMCSIFTAIPGAIIGKMEMGAIERGESPPEGLVFAQIGFWLSIVNVGLTLLVIIGYCCLVFGVVGLGAAGGNM